MTKKVMREILKTIQDSTAEASLTSKGGDGYLLYIQTYNKLRKIALAENWIDGDVVIELKVLDDSIFGYGEERLNIEKMDVIGAAAAIFSASLTD